ncbi:MAG TPA: dihydrofolate reductase family protein [Candidatus Sulfotelmatobacter sp.]|nr:dihydrofolate reductase family protein [Candidatus Sulfotelmatobacter sp.]
MRKIRIFEHISLDGVIQPEGDGEFANGGWSAPYRSPAGAEALAAAQGTSFDLLLGRRTYDLWSGHWPKIKGGPFADAINGATKYVATHRPESLAWGPVGNLGTDIIAGVHRLKSTDGPGLLVWGSSTLTPVLLEQGLVDEIVLLVYPLLLGRGKRCFSAARTRPRQHQGHSHGRTNQHLSARSWRDEFHESLTWILLTGTQNTSLQKNYARSVIPTG